MNALKLIPGLDIPEGVSVENKALYEMMLRSRFFEQKLESLFSKSRLYGTTHLAIGQEAAHTGLAAALEKEDWIVPTHRCHGYNIARGTSLMSMFSEMLGTRHGVCKGLGGSMHMTDISAYNLGSSAIVGSGISLAAGVAFALRRQNKENISVAIFGDGATSRGTLHEAMNIASVWKLPLLFYLENNHYGMSAPASRMISTDELYKRADGYQIRSEKVDGNDIFAVIDAVKRAREYIIREGRPYFIECDTYRFCGHSKSDKLVYRSREEESLWEMKDPIRRLESYLLEKGCSSDELASIESGVRKEVESAWEDAEKHSDDILSLEEASSYVLAPSEPALLHEGRKHKGTYREAIREALDEILSDSDSFSLMGEDIGKYGGCFGVTGDLYAKHGDQIYETPVSEETFVGMAAGAAMVGEHPICEVMYGDFSTLASDAIINHASKSYFMSAGQLKCPMIYRTPIGGGTGHGAQHTQNLENMFLNVPGLIAVAPSDPYSAKALLKSAAKENNPVLYFEHKALYDDEGEIGDEDSIIPLGKGILTERGEDALIIGYSRAISVAKKALEDKAVSFFDLATIKPLDEEGIAALSSKFDKILIVQDTPLPGSVGESVYRIASGANKRARIEIISALDLPIPFSRTLEMGVLVNEERILKGYEELLKESC